ncbi:mitochondrial import inner membrane translocase subunit Tim21 [Cylas formicarius]|uniref:mitochondrial import inner membrane translocase subunit Tim21 n=1 Tax=Cylas formicarius TaxID=197179 RepID=UPI002958DB24|nr:mitochondrial import inner membrane translocase subunit Tim21 [Cylas formicarius]
MFSLKAACTSRNFFVTKYCPLVCGRLYAKRKKHEKSIVSSSARGDIDTNVKPLGERVKETTKTASYLGIILLGVGVTGSLFYAVFSELFSSKSPNSVYSRAVKKCIEDPRIEDKLGYPIKAYGEETRRGRRQHISHVTYKDSDGVQHLRMKFHLKGTACSGTAHLDMIENDRGKYDYRYLFVEVDDMLRNTIVIEDNRSSVPNLKLDTIY